MRLLRYYYSFIQKIIEFVHRNDKGIKVLMFHQINDDKTKWIDSGVCVTQKSFETLIEQLINSKYEFISISQIEDSDYKNKIVVTFDDVFKDAFQNAFPFLVEKRIPFTVFVSEELVDSDGYLSSDDIKTLSECRLCTIGYHANHHSFLRNKSRSVLNAEITANDFEKKYGVKISYFAFSYGSLYAVGKEAVKVAEEMGYMAVFSTLSYELTKKIYSRNKYFLPRINICETTVHKVLGGKYEIN